ncbi:hypothetical protein L2744_12155 [Shewanella profunda]|uniref:hypothetical protein n=1 Tax=Shewanella profunda TaxID=254793 RepID=UPI002010AC0C|nr:hypothetical protein [Shewanella profunda]MCL1090331.1 hypothetical protein [Shewanella profunda]
MPEITAAQARANSEASTYGADEVVKQVSQFIEANSKTGATSITQILSKEAVSENELQGAITKLEARGFTVERICATAAQHSLKVSW